MQLMNAIAERINIKNAFNANKTSKLEENLF